jgi:hypothetical protein
MFRPDIFQHKYNEHISSRNAHKEKNHKQTFKGGNDISL